MKGLSHRFSLKNGKFQLTEGSNKAKDNVYFLMLFDNVSRIYRDDFAPKLLWLIQKNTSFVESRKSLILGRLRKVILKYVLNIQIESINMVSSRPTGDNSFEIYVNYTYTGNDEVVQDTAVKFI